MQCSFSMIQSAIGHTSITAKLLTPEQSPAGSQIIQGLNPLLTYDKG